MKWMWSAAVAAAAFVAAPVEAGLAFSVSYDGALTESYSGRVYVLFTTTNRPARMGPGWFSSEPFVAVDVKDWKPGDALTIDAENAISYPVPFAEIPEAAYRVQAVLRLNPDMPDLGSGAGNAYSDEVGRAFSGQTDTTVELRVDEVVPEVVFPPHDRIREFSMESPMLSAFFGRSITMRAAVILPKGYDDEENADRRYPTSYFIGGFGSDHRSAFPMLRFFSFTGHDADLVRVVPDPQCFGGHHVFADSANNGPRGRAFVEELIPALEKEYRLVAEPYARFTTGISSGGWSSLWLQVDHPDFFGGAWSIAPDPVDFRAFQLVDIYADGANMYTDSDGQPVAVAQQGGEPFAFVKDFVAMETVYGDGGQMRSFEWVFSPPSDGKPAPLFDRETGAVDPEVAHAWEAYDIRLVLERHWDTLEPKLAGKLHIDVGDEDTFYLHHAVVRLKAALEAMGSDAVINIHPGLDHGTIVTPRLMQRIEQEMIDTFTRGASRTPSAP